MDMGLPHRKQGTDTPDGAARPWADVPHSRPPVPPVPPPPASPPGGAENTTGLGVEAVPPPMPAAAPRSAPPLADWLRLPRPEAQPGVWRCGYQPRPPEDPERTPARQLVSGAIVSFLMGWLLWSLLWNGYLGSYWQWPLVALTPDSWREADGNKLLYVWASWIYNGGVFLGLAVFFGRIGRWDELVRRIMARLRGDANRRTGGIVPDGAVPQETAPAAMLPPHKDPVEWPELRTGGAGEAADRLAAELRAGRMTDVDHARIERAWQAVRARPQRLAAFVENVRAQGAGACGHPSGARDLPVRAARHDLSLRQVRIGRAVDSERNPHEYRGAGIALEPSLLGTSALAVGPPGTGKTTKLARPVVESLCLQALAGQAAVIAVSPAGGHFVQDASFDLVIRLGHPDSTHDLDLYGGTTDPDEAAGMLAEALVGDLVTALPGGDSRRAATALAQLIGPFAAVHGRFPAVPELRELLDGAPGALDALRKALSDTGQGAQLRELDAFERQSGRAGDTAALLADRIALLDRPAFADFFLPEGSPRARGRRPFSLRALEHPLRVRIDLPERGHAEASRILARLVLAQFTECAVARGDQSLFACLVLDDAAQTVTPQALRGLQRLRSAHAGVLLTLRALDDVPEPLRGPLLGAVGCRMVCAGVTPWDAERFAEVWGTEWVQTRTVTNRQLVSDEPVTRMLHAVRRLATGKHVTAESVTVRSEQRERWSASDLANELQPEHAVLSFTTVRGERTPPILTKLGE
ncbi:MULTISPECIES: ATP-binding protein [Streptomyces]|uniref:ATP-binding protein n=1 Tax=Streptomyces albus TaxID=1888 RepID=A0A8H1L787_9ACTN|nr:MULTISPECIES: ATP-binding protein [Streptomyces]KPC90104.1 ATP-binding protein [Streptomyces sp. NRRL F-6602]TGG78034.1 ATP-binding protein [Streptomyces albus]UVN54539.1 ATP-binding protein [Streptomyces albus]